MSGTADLPADSAAASGLQIDATQLLGSAWALVAALALAALAYAATLDNWFIGDDFWFLRSSREYGIADYALKVFDFREINTEYELNRYRPLYPLAWRLQYELFGMHAEYYRIVLLGLHLLCVVLAWANFRRLIGPAAAGAATIIFAVHPGYADAIAWLSGGNRVFATAPYLASLLAFQLAWSRDDRGRWVWLGASLSFYIVAVFMHSAAITLVGVFILYLFVLRGMSLRSREAWLAIAPAVLVAVALTAIQFNVRDKLDAEQAFTYGFHQYYNYGWYLGFIVLPIDHYGPTFGQADIIENVQLVASVAVLGAVGWALAAGSRVTAFTAGWLVLALLPDSTFVFARSGRELHIAGAASALLLVVVAQQWFTTTTAAWRSRVRAAAYVAVPLLVIGTMALTADRAQRVADILPAEDFAHQLRDANLAPGAGGTIYVQNPPPLGVSTTWLMALVEIYYPGARLAFVNSSSPPVLRPQDRLFIYKPE